ncbi:hypothetical protein JSY14_00880 [Brachybacterium sp. EF45031]|uniref:hypothetical protein n=1 Tax=Brachybacterium sillae TaxID=2810536 RepID=UPI00217EF9B6|nr:hypothetical protein [Brachybacterium sillae]MCS6710643.1 hypothetical protein [Brachybacterium sillae]
MTTAQQAQTPQDRLAHARAVLDAAERRAARHGGRIDRTALRPAGGSGAPLSLVPTPGREDGATTSAPDPGDGTRLPVPSALAALVPHGSLRAGSTVAVSGEASTSLLLALAVAAAGEDAWCAIAGLPDLGLRAALDAGLDPTRLALITGCSVEERPQLPQVLSAVVDGVGVVVLGPRLQLPPALWRSLTSRARAQDSLVLAATPPGRADLHLSTAAGQWEGLGSGSGRLRRRHLEVEATGRGIAGRRRASVLLPQVQGLLQADASRTDPAGISSAAASGLDAAARSLHVVRRAG